MVDLGCAPGAWLQVLAEHVGPEGRLLGADLEPVPELDKPVTLLELDITLPEAPERIAQALGRPADAVLSDAAPKLTGIAEVDRAAGEELCLAALRIAERVLDPRGCLVVKGFPGPESDRFRGLLRERFGRARELRPEGKRATSREFYWLAEPARRGRSKRGSR